MIIHNEGHPDSFTELHGEEKREEGDRGDQDKKLLLLSRFSRV